MHALHTHVGNVAVRSLYFPASLKAAILNLRECRVLSVDASVARIDSARGGMGGAGLPQPSHKACWTWLLIEMSIAPVAPLSSASYHSRAIAVALHVTCLAAVGRRRKRLRALRRGKQVPCSATAMARLSVGSGSIKGATGAILISISNMSTGFLCSGCGVQRRPFHHAQNQFAQQRRSPRARAFRRYSIAALSDAGS